MTYFIFSNNGKESNYIVYNGSRKEEPFSNHLWYQQHEGEPQKPAGKVAMLALCAALKESDLRIGINIWGLWPTDKLYYKAVIVKIQDPKLKKGRIFCIWEK